MLDINILRMVAANTDNVIFTDHVLGRIRQREVSKSDLLNVIKTGEIIEQYPNDYPFPSCLILGAAENLGPLHIVCGFGKNKIWVVTVYVPDTEEWEDDMKTRRR